MEDKRAETEQPKSSIADHRLLSREYHGKGRNYTPDERMFALSVYAETGSIATASKTTGIPKTTIFAWLKAEDIDQVLNSLRLAMRMGTAANYARLAIIATEQAIDRVQFGDEVLDRDNQLIRRKMSGRDLSAVASIATDKHALLTQEIQKENNVDKGLIELQHKLIKMLQSQGVNTTILEENETIALPAE